MSVKFFQNSSPNKQGRELRMYFRQFDVLGIAICLMAVFFCHQNGVRILQELLPEKQMTVKFFQNSLSNKQNKELHICVNLMILILPSAYQDAVRILQELLPEKQMAVKFFKNSSPNKQGKELHSCVNLMILKLLNGDAPSIPYVLVASPWHCSQNRQMLSKNPISLFVLKDCYFNH